MIDVERWAPVRMLLLRDAALRDGTARRADARQRGIGTVTDKELQKLNRRELLQLLLEQAQESEHLRGELAAAEERAREMDETFTRLRQRLNDKDTQIEEQEETFARLRQRLDQKDARIRELEEAAERSEAAGGVREIQVAGLSEVGSIAEAALQLNGIFEAAQKAADLYLQTVRERSPMPQEPAPRSVVVDAVIENAPPPREKTVIIAQPVRSVVDVEPRPAPPPQPEPEAQPMWQAPPAPPPAQPAAPVPPAPPAQTAEDSGGRGLFRRKKRRDGKGKFVLSFGWEQD